MGAEYTFILGEIKGSIKTILLGILKLTYVYIFEKTFITLIYITYYFGKGLG